MNNFYNRSEEPVDTKMDISTGHVVLVSEMLIFWYEYSPQIILCLKYKHVNNPALPSVDNVIEVTICMCVIIVDTIKNNILFY
jgi:hypothetical protein